MPRAVLSSCFAEASFTLVVERLTSELISLQATTGVVHHVIVGAGTSNRSSGRLSRQLEICDFESRFR